MSDTVRRFVLCLAVLVNAFEAASAGTPPPRPPLDFPSQVALITVDAVVLDSDDRPVAGLTQEDFVLREDGKPQRITSFEAFVEDAEPQAAGSVPPPAASTVVADNRPVPSREGRAFAILLDDAGIQQSQVPAACDAVRSFVDRSLRDGDEVTLGTTSGSLWWSTALPEGREDLLAVLDRLRGRGLPPGVQPSQRRADAPRGEQGGEMVRELTEYEAYMMVNGQKAFPGESRIDKFQMLSDRVPDRDMPLAREIDARRLERTRGTVAALRRMIDALAPVRGRKSLLLLSQGYLQDPQTGLLQEAAAASREGNVAIYFVDVRGLFGTSSYSADQRVAPGATDFTSLSVKERVMASAGTRDLADDTGGFSITGTSELAAGVERIARESRVFYLLGFEPPSGKPEKAWRKLHVAVKRPGLRVRARRGYTLRRASAPAESARQAQKGVAPALARALDSAHASASISLRALAYMLEPRANGRVHVAVAVEIEASRLAAGASGVARLESSIVALHRDSARGFRHDDTITLRVPDPPAPGWGRLVREFELLPGITQLRVAVRDTSSGAIGSLMQRLSVPALEGLRVSTPVVTDEAEAEANGQDLALRSLTAERLFRPGQLYWQFEVFGATGDSAAQVKSGYALRTRDGRLLAQAPPTQIAASREGRLVQLVALPLQALPAGEYELVFEVHDERNGSRVERREPFTLITDSSAR